MHNSPQTSSLKFKLHTTSLRKCTSSCFMSSLTLYLYILFFTYFKVSSQLLLLQSIQYLFQVVTEPGSVTLPDHRSPVVHCLNSTTRTLLDNRRARLMCYNEACHTQYLVSITYSWCSSTPTHFCNAHSTFLHFSPRFSHDRRSLDCKAIHRLGLHQPRILPKSETMSKGYPATIALARV